MKGNLGGGRCATATERGKRKTFARNEVRKGSNEVIDRLKA